MLEGKRSQVLSSEGREVLSKPFAAAVVEVEWLRRWDAESSLFVGYQGVFDAWKRLWVLSNHSRRFRQRNEFLSSCRGSQTSGSVPSSDEQSLSSSANQHL